MSTSVPAPADPPPPTGAPLSTDPPPAQVPYGGPVQPYDPNDPSALSTPMTAENVGKSVGGTAVKWGIRLLLPFLLRMIFRAVFRR